MENASVPSWVRHYQPGVPAEIELPTQPLSALLDEAVAAAGDHPALQFFGRQITYTELGDQVARLAGVFVDLGVRHGDRVAIMLPNCPQHVVAFYAVLRVGGIVVEHNPLYSHREIAEIVGDHGATVAICWDNVVDKLAGTSVKKIIAVNMIEAMPTLQQIALRLPVPKLRAARKKLHGKAPGTIRWREAISHAPLPATHPRPSVDDLAVIQYTSGTTGRPKGAMLTHANLYANARQGYAWMRDAVDRAETFYAVLPMFHAFGMTLYLTYGVMRQATLVLFPSFDVDLVLDAWRKTPATIYCAVPPVYEKTVARAVERGVDITSATYCICGGMTLSDRVVELWESATGGLLVEGYGMTEASPVCLGNPFWPTRRTGTIGVPFPSTRMKIVSTDDPSVEVAQGEPGELLVAGPQVFQGYWNDPDSTAATLLPGGWLRTGDVVVADEDGFVTIVDRLKEIIITGGFNVSPSEVERVLRTHEAVRDCAVVGMQQDDGSEQITAAIELVDGARLDGDALRAFCKRELAAYKVPRRFEMVDELPRSMLGKVVRKQVRDQLTSRR